MKVMLFFGWLFFCVAAAMFAVQRRNRSGIGWFFVAFFFSPLVAFVLLAILREQDQDGPSDDFDSRYRDFDDLPPSERQRLNQLKADLQRR
jgi:hypothetical protein